MEHQEVVLKNPDSCPSCGAIGNDILWGGSNVQKKSVFYQGHCIQCHCDFSQENDFIYKITTFTPGWG